MQLKFIQDEDWANYKLCSMFIGTAHCDFKCEKECGIKCCQNSALAKAKTVDVSIDQIIQRYLDNQFSKALVVGGMEPMLDFEDLLNLVKAFRAKTDEPIIIYTGYYENEIEDKLAKLKQFQNLIVKFGRFIPGRLHKVDELLGVELASDNQYAKKIS